ncbi:MAG: hypothetical protein ACFBSC_02345 [Microcoleaceae cyanobacterium]
MLMQLMDNRCRNYDSALGIRPPAPRPKYLIPAGPWLNEQGQLHIGFLHWKAKQWQKITNFGYKDMHREEVVGEVFKHYVSRPERLAIDWETYTRLCKQHLQAVQQRLQAGIEIPEVEQQEILNQTAALCYEPEEPIIPVDSVSQPLLPAPVTDVPTPQSLPAATEHSANPGSIPPNPREIPVDHNFQQKWRAALIKVAKPLPSATSKQSIHNSPQSLAEAMDWLQDSALRWEAVNWAKRQGYCIDYDESGQPIDLYQF